MTRPGAGASAPAADDACGSPGGAPAPQDGGAHPLGQRPLALHLQRSTAALAEGLLALQRFLGAAGAAAAGMYRAELVYEELVMNVIRHAHSRARESGATAIDVGAQVSGEDIVMTIGYEAEPFNPFQAALQALPASIEQAQVGGLGLRLVRSAAKRLEYRHRSGRNELTIVLGLR